MMNKKDKYLNDYFNDILNNEPLLFHRFSDDANGIYEFAKNNDNITTVIQLLALNSKTALEYNTSMIALGYYLKDYIQRKELNERLEV